MSNQLGLELTNQDVSAIRQANTVADVVKAVREESGLSLRDFAALFDVSHATISQWEHGIAEPDTLRLAQWFNGDREWVREMATEIFVARYRALLLARRDLEPTAA